MGYSSLDKIIDFLDKKDVKQLLIFNKYISELKRAEETLSGIVSSYTNKALLVISKMNTSGIDDNIKYSDTVLSLKRYGNYNNINGSLISLAMEYTITSANTNTNTKELIFKMIVPFIIMDYNKTAISEKIKIKTGSFNNCTIVLYKD